MDRAQRDDDPDIHRLLADWSPDAASIHDLSGRYLWASQGFIDLLGIDPHELVGRDAYDFFHPDDVPDIQISHQTVVELPTTFSVQYRIRRGDGTYRWVETTSRTSDEHDVIIALTRGIEERRSLLDALEAERLIGSRLRSLDRERHEFLTTVSHRARHPITVLLGYAQTLRSHRRNLREEEVDDLLDRMIASVERMRELVNEVTEAERLGRRAGRIEVRPLAVAEIARGVVETLADPDSPVTVDVADSTVVFADAQLLRIALLALLKNALRHTTVGTQIWVRAEPTAEGTVVIVEDSGEGIPEDERDVVFEAFAHVTRSDSESPDPGLGLGLNTVASIAATHHGRAWVEEREGGGASFRVLFPSVLAHRPSRKTAAGGSERPAATREDPTHDRGGSTHDSGFARHETE